MVIRWNFWCVPSGTNVTRVHRGWDNIFSIREFVTVHFEAPLHVMAETCSNGTETNHYPATLDNMASS